MIMIQLKHLQPKAIKNHTCSYCRCTIQVGEKYNRHTFVCDGRAYDWLSHKMCESLAYRLNMFDDVDEYGLDSDGFKECVREELVNHMSEDEEAKFYREYPTLIERVNYLLKIL